MGQVDARVWVVDPWEVIRQGLGAMIAELNGDDGWSYGLESVASLLDTAKPGDVALLSTAAIAEAGCANLRQPPCISTIVLMSSYEARDIELATTVKSNGYMSLADIT